MQEDRRWPPTTKAEKDKGFITEKCPMDLEMAKLPNLHGADAPGTSKEGGEGQDDTTGAAAAGRRQTKVGITRNGITLLM
ncbi:hypothetical protein U1Q18_001292 [Sarracenia purpurea var. burkii]